MEVGAGTRIADRYVIERALAKGGMGAVYVARDERMGARAALKITAAGGAAADELAKRFAREARIGHRLGTGRLGFVRASDWGRIDAVQLYLVMDLVENAKVLDLRTGSREERVARWRRAAELVRIAHENGVIHRDLKPANFLQGPDGSIFLTDFGLAKVVGEDDESSEELTLTGVGFGTTPYMPPEQLEDAKHADARADVFALGCMLFEALVARLPYPGPTPTAVMSAHMKVKAGVLPAPRPRDVDPSVPEALDQACMHALELDVALRAASVAALFDALAGGSLTKFEPGPAPNTIGAAATPPPDAAPKSISGGVTTPPTAPLPSSDASSAPSTAALSDLPTGARVPTRTPDAPSSSSPSAPPPGGPKRALPRWCLDQRLEGLPRGAPREALADSPLQRPRFSGRSLFASVTFCARSLLSSSSSPQAGRHGGSARTDRRGRLGLLRELTTALDMIGRARAPLRTT